MKATAFFTVVFLSMLGFFIVATGEFKHWLDGSAEGPGGFRVSHNISTGGSGKNYLDFDFWNVKLGRRNFTLRAELPRDDLKDGARIDELENLNLRNGTIDIPIYEGDGVIRAVGWSASPLKMAVEPPTRGPNFILRSCYLKTRPRQPRRRGLFSVQTRRSISKTPTWRFTALPASRGIRALPGWRFSASTRRFTPIWIPMLLVASPSQRPASPRPPPRPGKKRW